MRRRSNWLDDRAQERAKAIAACPHVDNPGDVANNAAVDAMYLIEAVRDLDPREVWGRLAIWTEENPVRLYAAVVALAAMVPNDQPVSELLKWTDRIVSPARAGAIRRPHVESLPPRELTHDQYLRAARAAYVRGLRDVWVLDGNREYERRRKQRHRDRRQLQNNEQGAA